MAETIDDEINAIKVVLRALEPLDPDIRRNVFDYVARRLGIAGPESAAPPATVIDVPKHPAEAAAKSAPLHLAAFAKQKSPKSANEMAAVVAYYLAEMAPASERRKTVNADAIKTYFKIGDYPLPEIRFTLPNAKAAGYFDAVGDGEYRLNPVGHNLVAHSLPRSKDGVARASRLGRKKGAPARRPK